MKKILFAFDLDGTLCNDAGYISPITKQYLQALKEKGHIVCLATGRRGIDLLPLKNDLHLADYLLLNNGGKIVQHESKKMLCNSYLPEQASRSIIEYCLDNNYLLYVLKDKFWAVNVIDKGVKEYIAYIGESPKIYQSIKDINHIDKIEGFTVTQESDYISRFILSNKLAVSFVKSEENSMDIMAKGVSKKNSLEWLIKSQKLEEYTIVTVGDYDNDIEMIRFADIGIAVNNALPSVKHEADFVTTRTNNQDMIKDITHYLKIL